MVEILALVTAAVVLATAVVTLRTRRQMQQVPPVPPELEGDVMSKARVEQPDAESTNPALAVGGIGSIGALLALLLIRYAGLDPEVAFGVGMVAGPIVTSALIRAKVYSPATVARLLATRSGER